MKAAKIFAQIFLICLLLSLPTVANAELQGGIYDDDVVTEDGESFNVGEFNKALDDGNIYAAESIYNDFVKRRQDMLKRGTEFGILDLYIKHCYARILYLKKDYKASIAVEDEVLDYWRTHVTKRNKYDANWINQIANSMIFKKCSYDKLKDYASALKVQKVLVQFLSLCLPYNNPNLLKEKMHLSSCYYNMQDYKTALEIRENLIPQFEIIFGETDENTLKNYKKLIDVYETIGDYKKMGICLNRVVPIVENLSADSDLKFDILMQLVKYYICTNQYQKSLELGERLLGMSISNENKCNLLWHMADEYRMFSDYSNALRHIAQAWDIYEKNIPEDKYTRASILLELGNMIKP